MDAREGEVSKFQGFMKAHRTLLDCYASSGMHPAAYKYLDAPTQHDFCFAERSQLEDQLFKQKVRPQDFFKAAQSV